ncbi:hypothetical protein R50073_00370 [Maricurvus nonylphenolicus]|uniref:hypothetical protein n=1 Tax=Maricurvus nonylphenolicus TaxID=1008307 RepID=UPI0036F4365E
MISFGNKKKQKTNAKASTSSSQSGAEQDSNGPSRRQQMQALQRMVNAVKIGSRIRYHQEYEEASVLESLVIGYRINNISLYRQSDIQFEEDDGITRVLLQTEIGQERFARIESMQLIVPGAIGEERKLDYDSRATLGRRGQFAPKSKLVLMSTNFNTEHLKLDVVVERNLKLTDGVHTGLQVAYLDVLMGTLSRHEPRQFTRVAVSLPVTVCKNGTEQVLPATLLDFSEKSVRLTLDPAKDLWPEFGKKDFALIGLKSSMEKPMVKLQAQCIEVRGQERIFEMTHIQRQGSASPIEMIDVLEIKIDLMNRAESTLN